MTYYNELILASSPTVYFKLDETSGSTAANAGSDGGTGTIAAGVTLNQTGINAGGKAILTAGGTTSYVSKATAGTVFSDKVFSVEWWQKGGANSKDVGEYYGSGAGYGVLINASGKLVFTIYGGTTNVALVSATTVTGTTWHHIVFTANGNSFKLYIDGTLEASSTTNIGTFAPSATLYVGSYQATAAAASYDEFALYDSELSSTVVAAHRTAGTTTPVNGGYSPTAMTASEAMPSAVVVASHPGGYSPTPMTASASMPTNVAYGTKAIVTSRDFGSSDEANTPIVGANPLITSSSSGALIDFELPFDYTDAGKVSATLRLYQESAASGTITVQVVSAEWADTDRTHTFGSSTTVTVPTTVGWQTIDVTSLVSKTGFYGFRVTSNTHRTFTSMEGSNPATLNLGYVSVQVPVTYSAQPFSADAGLPTAGVGVGDEIRPDPMTASADMPSATVIGIKAYTYTAEPCSAAAEMGLDNHFALPVTLSATALTAGAETVSGVPTTATGVVYYADTAMATVTFNKPALVNGSAIVLEELDDTYFNRVFALVPTVWQRLHDQGSTALDRMARYNGVYHGVQTGKFDGPDGRPSVHFVQGSYLEQNEPTGSNQDEAWIQDGSAEQSALEFSFRTSKANTFLMAGADSTQTSQGVASSYAARELYLTDGRLTFISHIFAGTPDQVDKQFTGVRNLADGNWHHVVVKSGVYNGKGQWATELWVDGTFEIRRFDTNGFMGFPDFIGFRPNYIDGSELPTLPLSQGFEGDMTEVAFYDHNNLPSEDIARNYYALMGWAPIYAAPLEASAALTNSKGKGSQKKALYLYWTGLDEVFGGLNHQPGQSVADSISFDPNPALVNAETYTGGLYRGGETPEMTGDYFGFKVFTRSITLDKRNGQLANYRDPITDDISLINLETDIDLSDYEVIMFKDWPDEGYELDTYEERFPGQKDRLLRQIREASDNGIGLYITNPRLAVDLGIVDRVEFVPSLTESKVSNAQGAAIGLYDYASALVFPWNIVGSDGLTGGVYATGIGVPEDLSPAYLENKAYFYQDTHANNRFRVRALVTGLTDLPSWQIDEAVFHVDYDQYGWQGVAYKYLKRDSGLIIGDEYIFNGTEMVNGRYEDSVEKRYSRYAGTWSTPPGHVKAGTVVTTYGATHWVGKSEVDNPFKDYATTIVLEPGQSLNGKAVGGRIFVNFTEAPSQGLAVAVQDMPSGSTGLPHNYGPETAAQRAWDYSWTRTTLASTTSTGSTAVTITLPNGDQQVINIGNNDTNLAQVRSNQLFPISGRGRLEMDGRGMYWLAAATKPQPGEAVVRATPMTANAEVKQPTVIAHKTNEVRAESMLATVSMPRVAEDTYGDTIVRAIPLTAEAKLNNYVHVVSATPMLATAEFVEPFDAVHTSGEQVVLVLHSSDATLYLKEEA